MNKYIILILLLSTIWTGCDGTGGPDPPDKLSIDKIIYTNNSQLRQDTVIVISPIINYKGSLIKDTSIVALDTTYEDKDFRYNLFSWGLSDHALWAAQGNLPDTNSNSEVNYQTLKMTRRNGEERTIKFSEKIIEIDSLIIQFEQLCFKLLH